MKTTYNKSVFLILIIWIGIIQATGCKKFVEAELPIDKLTAKAVFSSTDGASSVLSNIYYLFPSNFGGTNGPSAMNGLTADELVLENPNNMYLSMLYTNSLSSEGAGIDAYWNKSYELVFRVNSVIEGVENSQSIPLAAKNELIGQSKFLRAFVYFYLVNLYGGVPIVTSTDYKTNTLLPRSSEFAVYEQIIKDLTNAQSLVSENYLKPDLITPTLERVTANKAVTTALLARVYLYVGQWQKAEAEATKIINNPNYSILTSLNDVFLKNSNEAIWQIEGNVAKGENSLDGSFFIPGASVEIPLVHLSNSFLNVIDSDDRRRNDWLGTVDVGSVTLYYPYKYKQNLPSETTEYNMMLRLAEQYLIRSEARAHLNNIDGAIADLNIIRKRAEVTLYANLDQQTLLGCIEKERQLELFSEFGHRWFDLKRTGRADAVLAPIKGSNWQTTDKLFPIPFREFLRNPGLRGHQNPGYTE